MSTLRKSSSRKIVETVETNIFSSNSLVPLCKGQGRVITEGLPPRIRGQIFTELKNCVVLIDILVIDNINTDSNDFPSSI